MMFIKINSVTLPSPTKYKIGTSDFDSENSITTESGFLIRDRVRADRYKVMLEWKNITVSQMNTIIKAIAPASFQVELYDPTVGTGTHLTKKMYASANREKDLNAYINESESYWNYSVTLLEY